MYKSQFPYRTPIYQLCYFWYTFVRTMYTVSKYTPTFKLNDKTQLLNPVNGNAQIMLMSNVNVN